LIQRISSRRWTRATCCLTRIVLYAEVDAQCDKLASNVDRRKYCQLISSTNDVRPFITLSVRIRRTQLTTRRDEREFSPSRIMGKVAELQHSVERSLCTNSQLDPLIRFDRTPLYDDTRTSKGPQLIYGIHNAGKSLCG